MQQRNYIVFIILSVACLIGWQTFVLPRLMPPRKPVAANNPANLNAPKDAAAAKDDGKKRPAADAGAAVAKGPSPAGQLPVDKTAAKKDAKVADAKADKKPLADFPTQT